MNQTDNPTPLPRMSPTLAKIREQVAALSDDQAHRSQRDFRFEADRLYRARREGAADTLWVAMEAERAALLAAAPTVRPPAEAALARYPAPRPDDPPAVREALRAVNEAAGGLIATLAGAATLETLIAKYLAVGEDEPTASPLGRAEEYVNRARPWLDRAAGLPHAVAHLATLTATADAVLERVQAAGVTVPPQPRGATPAAESPVPRRSKVTEILHG